MGSIASSVNNALKLNDQKEQLQGANINSEQGLTSFDDLLRRNYKNGKEEKSFDQTRNNSNIGVSFKVDNVKQNAVDNKYLLDSKRISKVFITGGESEEKLEACGITNNNQLWIPTSRYVHGFFSGAIYAFDNHYPFSISPDHIFQLILEGWSRHVEKNAETLRKVFVSHEGKKILKVKADNFVKGSPNNPWHEMFQSFAQQIKDNSNPELYATVNDGKFTTTGPVEIIARNVSLMSLTKHYFDFRMSTCCGFPEITLEGTRDDWVLLKQKVNTMTKFMTSDFSNKWIPALNSILDKFLDAFDNKIDIVFWGSMVKQYSTHGSGADTYITGWINVLYPYIGTESRVNEWAFMDWNQQLKFVATHGGPRNTRAPSVSDYSRFFCSAPVEWQYFDKTYNMTFKTGIVGSTQSLTTGYVRPQISWAVVENIPITDSESHDLCFY